MLAAYLNVDPILSCKRFCERDSASTELETLVFQTEFIDEKKNFIFPPFAPGATAMNDAEPISDNGKVRKVE